MQRIFIFIKKNEDDSRKIHTVFTGDDEEFITFMLTDPLMSTSEQDETNIRKDFLDKDVWWLISVGPEDDYFDLQVYKTDDETNILPRDEEEEEEEAEEEEEEGEEFEELPPEPEGEDVATAPSQQASQSIPDNPDQEGGKKKKKKKSRKHTQRKKRNGSAKVRRHKTRRVF